MNQSKVAGLFQLLAELEELAKRCGLEVRHEKLLREVGYRARSGSCRVREKALVIIDRGLGPAEQLEVLAGILRENDLEQFYLSPAARRLLLEEAG